MIVRSLVLILYLVFCHGYALAANKAVDLPLGISFQVPDDWLMLTEESKEYFIDRLQKEVGVPGLQQMEFLFGTQSANRKEAFNIMVGHGHFKTYFQEALSSDEVVKGLETAIVQVLKYTLKHQGIGRLSHKPASAIDIWGQKAWMISTSAVVLVVDLPIYMEQYIIYQDGYILAFTFMSDQEALPGSLQDIKDSIIINPAKMDTQRQ